MSDTFSMIDAVKGLCLFHASSQGLSPESLKPTVENIDCIFIGVC